MVAPTLTSDHPGLELLAEVAKVLAAGRPAEEGLAGVVAVLRRGLALRRCRLWLRSADGFRFLPIASPDDEAQRNFAARIIDSLPVGLYVIDRGYRIRAWNRKREAGTQGVSREDALGREVFEVLDRQPRELLKLEFDRVFATGEIQTVDMDSQTTGEARH